MAMAAHFHTRRAIQAAPTSCFAARLISLDDEPDIGRLAQTGLDYPADLLHCLGGANRVLHTLLPTGGCCQPAPGIGIWRCGRLGAGCRLRGHELRAPGAFLADADKN